MAPSRPELAATFRLVQAHRCPAIVVDARTDRKVLFSRPVSNRNARLNRQDPDRVRTILEATLCMKWTIHTRWSYRSAGEDSRADRCSLQFGAQQRSTQRSGSDWQ